jgi:D-amino-acid dehydrogenase
MKKIAVVGAGIIGICCALELKRKGFDVTLFDENLPASQTSSGNAGVICTAGIAPYASPEILPRLPAYAINIDPKFKFHWPHFFEIFPFLSRFILNCNWQKYEQTLNSLHYITRDAVERHTKLLAEANSNNLFRDRGWLKLYRTDKGFASSSKERQNYNHYGISATMLESRSIRELEPAIIRNYAKALLLDGSPSVTNPWAQNRQAYCRRNSG